MWSLISILGTKSCFLLKLFLTAKIGLATTFYPDGDPWNPDPGLACMHGRILTHRDVVVAHPTLPCRSRVWIYNLRTNRSTVAVVADRGPRRALVDLGPATAKLLRANGYEQVVLIPIPE